MKNKRNFLIVSFHFDSGHKITTQRPTRTTESSTTTQTTIMKDASQGGHSKLDPLKINTTAFYTAFLVAP